MTKEIIILDDSLIQQEVARIVLGRHSSVLVPKTVENIRNIPGGNDVLVILIDRSMPDDWRKACWDLIDRCPLAKVVEWTAYCGMWIEEEELAKILGPRHPRINWTIHKTGTGKELIDAVKNSVPMKRVLSTPPYFDDRDSVMIRL